MERALIIHRMEATIEKLKGLDESQFNYEELITTFDLVHHCPTVACIAGYYPAWFPEAKIVWKIKSKRFVSLDSSGEIIYEQALSDYHGFSNVRNSLMSDLCLVLFYGGELVIGGVGILRAVDGIHSNLRMVIELWETTLNLIKNYYLDQYLNLDY